MTAHNFQRRVNEILEPGSDGDITSKRVDVFLASLVVINIIAVALESVASLGLRYASLFAVIEMVSVVIFSLEYILRFWSAKAKLPDEEATGPHRPRRAYIFSFSGLIDLFSILPFYLQAFFPGLDLRVLRTLRLLRIFKLSNYNTAVEDLFSAIVQEKRSFYAAFYLFVLVFIVASSLIYYAEHKVQPDVFGSIPEAMYWALITLTTVGFGDVTPITNGGKFVAVLTAIMGVSVVALMTGIIANAFNNQMEKRKLIFQDRVRHALADGIVDAVERRSLEQLRKDFGLSKQQADSLLQHVEDERGTNE
ncbi:MAG: ion transporter [Gammaproteobacteria bacterium]|nr:ion transporter [Gammaproteobacteria bacterium]MCP4880772.1 ion transporter [Gammaproteobacteria bacterium]MDP6165631.1 ion transporter [Gammaproteobacteria bacterium]